MGAALVTACTLLLARAVAADEDPVAPEPPSVEPPAEPAVDPVVDPVVVVLSPPSVLGVDPLTLRLLSPPPPSPPWRFPALYGGTGNNCLDATPGLAVEPWCRVAVDGLLGPTGTGP